MCSQPCLLHIWCGSFYAKSTLVLLRWQSKYYCDGKVDNSSGVCRDLVYSTITYWFGEQASDQVGDQPKEQARVQAGVQAKEQARVQAGVQAKEQAKEQVQRLVNVIREDAYTVSDLLRLLHLTGRTFFNALKSKVRDLKLKKTP